MSGVVRTVTTAVDDPTGSTVGSLRYHLNAHQAAWLADQSAAPDHADQLPRCGWYPRRPKRWRP